MMTRRAWSFGDDRQASATAMITTRAMHALLPVHHRRVARTHVTLKDFADPLAKLLVDNCRELADLVPLVVDR